MQKEDTVSKWFVPDNLTFVKKQIIREIAVRVRTAKNVISMFVYLHHDYFLENILSKYDFYSYITGCLPNVLINLPSQVKTELIEDVYEKYKQQKDNIKEALLGLMLTHYKSAEHYDRKTTVIINKKSYTYKKGAVKDVTYDRKKTEYTIMTATLSLFYGDEDKIRKDFSNYIQKNIEDNVQKYKETHQKYLDETDKEKKEKLSKKLESINKDIWHFILYALIMNFQPEIFKRMLAVSMARRKRIIEKMKYQIEFNTLNFRARSKVKCILQKNNNSNEHYKERGHHSEVNAYIDLGGIAAEWGYKHLYVPVLYSKSYHGKMSDYNRDTTNHQYLVIFDKHNDFRFQLANKENFDWPDYNDEMILVGGDQNMKHNMEQFSDGYSIDWPRDKMDELVKLEIRIDEATNKKKSLENIINLKKKNADLNNIVPDIKTEVLMIRDLDNKINQLKPYEKEILKSIKGRIERTISKMFKHYIKKYGKGNFALVLENLDGMFRSNRRIKYICADGTEYSQNKLFRLCHFGELKDTIKRMGKRSEYRVPVSFVPSYYSSQICPLCGNIDRNNRTVQELVHCTKCNAEFSADLKSAQFLTLILSVQKLRDTLLEADGTGAYVPKKSSKKEKTKKTYEKYSLAIV